MSFDPTFAHTPAGQSLGDARPLGLFDTGGAGPGVPPSAVGHSGNIPIMETQAIVQQIVPQWFGQLGSDGTDWSLYSGPTLFSVGAWKYLVVTQTTLNPVSYASPPTDSYLWWQLISVNPAAPQDRAITLSPSGVLHETSSDLLPTAGWGYGVWLEPTASDGTLSAVNHTSTKVRFALWSGSAYSMTSFIDLSSLFASGSVIQAVWTVNASLAFVVVQPPSGGGVAKVITVNPTTATVIDQFTTGAFSTGSLGPLSFFVDSVLLDQSTVLLMLDSQVNSVTPRTRDLQAVQMSGGHFTAAEGINHPSPSVDWVEDPWSPALPSPSLPKPGYYIPGGAPPPGGSGAYTYFGGASGSAPNGDVLVTTQLFGVTPTFAQWWNPTYAGHTHALPPGLTPTLSGGPNSFLAGSKSVASNGDIWMHDSSFQTVNRIHTSYLSGGATGWQAFGGSGSDWSFSTPANARTTANGPLLASTASGSGTIWSFNAAPGGTYGSGWSGHGYGGNDGVTDAFGTPLFMLGGAGPFDSGPPAGAHYNFYLWAGQTASVQIGSRPEAPTFIENAYNESFDFGSFPNAIMDWNPEMLQCSFACADLNGVSFPYGVFSQCDLSYANLTGCTFGSVTTPADIELCSLAYADCTGSTFYGAGPLSGDRFYMNDCTETIFRNCQFINVVFHGGGFIGADFSGAQFTGCTWVNNTADDTTRVYWDSSTKWPSGFNPHTQISLSRDAYLDYSNQNLADVVGVLSFWGHANLTNAVIPIGLPLMCAHANFAGAQLVGETMAGSSSTMCWADFSGATIDFGNAVMNSSLGAKHVLGKRFSLPICAHANFSNVTFTWSGAGAAGTVDWVSFMNTNMAYANFNGVKRGAGLTDKRLVFFECNAAWATFFGADLGPTDHFGWDGKLPGDIAGFGPYNVNQDPMYTLPDTNMAYADFSGCKGGAFGSCDLSHAKFVGANVPYSDFNEAYIGDADFTGATVTPTAFYGTMTDTGSFAGGTIQLQVWRPGDPGFYCNLSSNGVPGNYRWNAVAFLFLPNGDPPGGLNSVVSSYLGSGDTAPLYWVYAGGNASTGSLTNAQTGGNGWLGVFVPSTVGVHQFAYPNAYLNFFTVNPIPPLTSYACGVIVLNHSMDIRNLQFKVGGPLSAGSSASVPTVPHAPKQNGMFYIFGLCAKPPPGETMINHPDGVQWGWTNLDQSPTAAAANRGSSPIWMTYSNDVLLGLGYAINESDGHASFSNIPMNIGGASYVSFSVAMVPGPVTPALSNAGTTLPTGVAVSSSLPPAGYYTQNFLSVAAQPAVTGQTDPRQSATDGHEDFSGQTIDPSARNWPTGAVEMSAFGADFNHSHWTGDAPYDEVFAYNSNFQGATLDPGFVWGSHATTHTSSYQSHWGGPPTDIAIPRGSSLGIPGPRRVWKVP